MHFVDGMIIVVAEIILLTKVITVIATNIFESFIMLLTIFRPLQKKW